MLYSEEQGGIPSWELLDSFLTRRSVVLSIASSNSKHHKKTTFNLQQMPHKKQAKSKRVFHVKNPPNSCRLYHKGSQFLYFCPDFKAQNSESRYQKIQNFNHCYNCLGTDHQVKDCSSKRSCKECRQNQGILQRRNHLLTVELHWLQPYRSTLQLFRLV